MSPPFERSVFINCPFDEDYAPTLQAMLFCVVYLGLFPRLAPENPDNSTARLDRIIELIGSSKYGIHDVSLCKAQVIGEFARMNMPFELGLDYACRRFGGVHLKDKKILVLESNRYDFQKALSDISGWDIHSHDDNFQKAVRRVRNWLVAQADAEPVGAALIQGKYIAFQEWYWERELAIGSSEDDIRDYPTITILSAMHDWMAADQPT